MPKLSLDPIGSLENQTSAVQVLNENFDRIEAALEKTLSRDGTTPNSLTAPLDVNGQRVINLPAPQAASDPARWVDLTTAYILQGSVVPGLAGNQNRVLTTDGSTLLWAVPADLPDVGDLKASNNLSELVTPATARSNLGLGTIATENSGDYGRLDAAVTRTGSTVHTGVVTLGGVVNHQITTTPAVLTDESLGFRGVPSTTVDVDYTFVLNDSGKAKLHTSGTAHAYTVPANATVAYPNGTVLVADNIGSGVINITRAAGVTLRISGSPTDAGVAVAQWGTAYIRKLATNTWVVSGTNLS